MNIKIIGVACSVLLLAGCYSEQDKFKDIQEKMLQADAQAGPPIEPLPQPKEADSFKYEAHLERSPFDQPKSIRVILQQESNKDVKPNFDRPREILENFPLDALRFKGTLARTEEGGLTALIAASDGNIYQVFQGRYMGKNHGLITRVTEQRIDLEEIVSDEQGGWLKRPASIELNN